MISCFDIIMFLAIIGISLEIAGFVFMINSTRRLILKEGDFVADIYVDPNTNEPPHHIEGSPNPSYYRPGIYMIVVGLVIQIADILMNQRFNLPL
jgi:hypothetical protein